MSDNDNPKVNELPPMPEEKSKMLANEQLLKSDAFAVLTMTNGKIECHVQYGKMSTMGRQIYLRACCQVLLKICEQNDEIVLNKLGMSQFVDKPAEDPELTGGDYPIVPE